MTSKRRKVEMALRAVDAEQAYHWPTIAAILADEVRRLREVQKQLAGHQQLQEIR